MSVPPASKSGVRVAAVVAVAANNVIGNGNQLPWHLPADLKYFRAITMGKPVIMGRRTFQSIGRPLPGRDNIVISHARDWTAAEVRVVPGIEAAISAGQQAAAARAVDEIMVIGGAQIYTLAMPYLDRLYVTEIALKPRGDTCFPAIDPTLWRETSRDPQPAAGEFPAHDFVIYDRRA